MSEMAIVRELRGVSPSNRLQSGYVSSDELFCFFVVEKGENVTSLLYQFGPISEPTHDLRKGRFNDY